MSESFHISVYEVEPEGDGARVRYNWRPTAGGYPESGEIALENWDTDNLKLKQIVNRAVFEVVDQRRKAKALLRSMGDGWVEDI